jgi:ADP-heptose:LPS heptosyltransferase
MSRRVLVLRPGAIGDTLLAAPALVALRGRYPGRLVQVVGNERALPVLAAMGLADAWLAFGDPAVTRLFMAGDPPPGDPFRPLEAAVAWCADTDGALARSLGRRGAAQPVIAPSRPPPGQDVHVARHLLRTLAPLGVAVDRPLEVPETKVPDEVRASAEADLAIAGLAGRAFAVVHPGSGSPTKNWPPEHFAVLIERLAVQHGLAALMLAGPADADATGRVQAGLREPVPVLTERPLLVLADVLRLARVFLGNDSGLSHLAGMVGTPTLVLFGPSDPALWSPLGGRVRVVRHQPLAELASDVVLREIQVLLSS